MKRMLVPGLAMLFLAGCFLFPKEEEKLAPPLMEPPKVTYELISVKKSSIIDDFVVNGVFRYTKQENLYFKARGGRLLKIYVRSADRVKTGQLLAELDSDALKYEVSMQEIAVQKARLVAEHTTVLGRDKYEQQLAALDVKQAELTLDSDKTELAKAQLFSPMDGVVDYLSNFAEGDAVDAYRTVLRVADPRVIELVYDGEQSSEFTMGMPVEVTYKDKILSGTVVRTSSAAPADVPDSEKGLTVINVRNLPNAVQTGELASLRVVRQRHDKVIVVPRTVVQPFQGANYVDVLKDGIRRQTAVELGIVTTTEVEIVKGLSEGDQVIVR